jgi:hypothetical protein
MKDLIYALAALALLSFRCIAIDRCCTVDTRKDWANVTPKDHDAFISGLSYLKSQGFYDAFIGRYVNECGTWNSADDYLQGSRRYLQILQEALRAIDPKIVLSYINFTSIANAHDGTASSKFGKCDQNDCVVSDKFRDWLPSDGCIKRNVAFLKDFPYKNSISDATDFDQFGSLMRKAISGFLGGNFDNARMDPMFVPSLVYQDFLWEAWMRKNKKGHHCVNLCYDYDNSGSSFIDFGPGTITSGTSGRSSDVEIPDGGIEAANKTSGGSILSPIGVDGKSIPPTGTSSGINGRDLNSDKNGGNSNNTAWHPANNTTSTISISPTTSPSLVVSSAYSVAASTLTLIPICLILLVSR